MNLLERVRLALHVRDLHPPGSYAYNRWHYYANQLDVQRELQYLFWLDDEGRAKRAAIQRMNERIRDLTAIGA